MEVDNWLMKIMYAMQMPNCEITRETWTMAFPFSPTAI